MVRYFKLITLDELSEYGFDRGCLTNAERGKALFIRSTKRGLTYNPKNPLLYHEGEIKSGDVVFIGKHKCTIDENK